MTVTRTPCKLIIIPLPHHDNNMTINQIPPTRHNQTLRSLTSWGLLGVAKIRVVAALTHGWAML